MQKKFVRQAGASGRDGQYLPACWPRADWFFYRAEMKKGYRVVTRKKIAGDVVHELPADLKKVLPPIQRLWKHRKILRRLRVMSGYAGLNRPKSRKPETNG